MGDAASALASTCGRFTAWVCLLMSNVQRPHRIRDGVSRTDCSGERLLLCFKRLPSCCADYSVSTTSSDWLQYYRYYRLDRDQILNRLFGVQLEWILMDVILWSRRDLFHTNPKVSIYWAYDPLLKAMNGVWRYIWWVRLRVWTRSSFWSLWIPYSNIAVCRCSCNWVDHSNSWQI